MSINLRLKIALTGSILAVFFGIAVGLTQDFEIENMPIKTAGHEVADGWALDTVGYVADTLIISKAGFYRVKIRAKRWSSGGNSVPQMDVRVDGKICGPVFVDENYYVEYKVLNYLETGEYQFEIHLTNNISHAELILDRVSIYSVEFTEEEWLLKVAESTLNKYPSPWNLSISNWQIEELMWGMAKAYEQTGDAGYLNFIRSHLDGHVTADGELDVQIKDTIPGILLIWLHRATNETKYLLAAQSVGNFILNEYPRTSDGGLLHLADREGELWVDTLGGLGRFLGWLGWITNDAKYFDEGAQQFIIHASHLQDPETGLFYHGWDEDRSAAWSDPVTGTSDVFWARGNGWVLRGLVDFLEFLPHNHPQRGDLLEILEKLVNGIVQYQDENSGLWYTVIDAANDSSNYIETAAGLLIVYGIQKALRLHLLPDTYQEIVTRANRELYEKIYDKGNLATFVTGISGGTTPGNYENYITIPLGNDEAFPSGRGLFLQEKFEMMAGEISGLSILSIYVSNITDTSAVISWTTDKASNGQVKYGIDENYEFSTEIKPTLVNLHQFELNGLQENTAYHFQVISETPEGESIASTDAVFETLSSPNLSFSNISRTSGFGLKDGVDALGGHGVLFADVDSDGFVDIYLTRLFDGPIADLFFHNENDNIFSEEAAQRGVADFDGGSHGACFADIDNDGDYDLINGTTFDFEMVPANNNIFRNDGNGYFEEITESTGLANNHWPTRGVLAFDMDKDGDLDIFTVSNYQGSDDPPNELNELYRNDGNFRFTSIDTSALVFAKAGQGATAVDYDNDGDLDVFAANRTGKLNILQNDGVGNFTPIDPDSIGIFHQGRESITFGDINRDGFLDMLLVGDPTGYYGYLYTNNGDGTFSFSREFEAIAGYMGSFADIDNDGDLDIVFAGDDVCYLNDGAGNFEVGAEIPVDGLNDPRAISYADIDNDGDLDFAVGCKRSISLLIRNNLKTGNWINVKLESALGQAGAFGARVYIYPVGLRGENLIMMQEAQSSQGYLGQNEPILHFGVGYLNQVDVVVKFLDGRIVEKNNVATNQTIFVKPESDIEVVYPPRKPAIKGYFFTGAEIVASCDSAKSNLNHDLEYRFDWGDGTFSVWGDSSGTHVYEYSGEYEIRARARCKLHQDVVSVWSEPNTISIRGLNCHSSVLPQGSGQIEKSPLKEEYFFGDTLTLTAVPDSGFQFIGWSGDTNGVANPLVVSLTRDFDIIGLFSPLVETITIPNKPVGEDTVILGKSAQFATNGSMSNLGHDVEYQFDWGDNTFSEWGDSVQQHIYIDSGIFQVRSRARCRLHSSVMSDWSVGKSVVIRALKIFVYVVPDSAGNVQRLPDKTNYAYQDTVTLLAVPAKDMQFCCWSGDVEGDTSIVSVVLSGDLHVQCRFEEITEVLTRPKLIQGSRFLYRKQSGTFVAKFAKSNLGHVLEYQFDWGDGNLSYWGDSSQSRVYYENGEYAVRCRVRCAEHKNVLSEWSDTLLVHVRGCKICKEILPDGAGLVEIMPEKSDYDFNEPVHVSAHPVPNYTFSHWNSGQDSAASIQMNVTSDTTIKAYFRLLTGVDDSFENLPQKFSLSQNYPNPFNMETIIEYQVPKSTHVRLRVYNISGQQAALLVDRTVSPGLYKIRWDGTGNNKSAMPSGVYWLVFETEGNKFYRKMVLLR